TVTLVHNGRNPWGKARVRREVGIPDALSEGFVLPDFACFLGVSWYTSVTVKRQLGESGYGRRRISKQLADRLNFLDEVDEALLPIRDGLRRVDPQRPVDRGQQVAGAEAALLRLAAVAGRGTDDAAALDAAAAEQGVPRPRPVPAARLPVDGRIAAE